LLRARLWASASAILRSWIRRGDADTAESDEPKRSCADVQRYLCLSFFEAWTAAEKRLEAAQRAETERGTIGSMEAASIDGRLRGLP